MKKLVLLASCMALIAAVPAFAAEKDKKAAPTAPAGMSTAPRQSAEDMMKASAKSFIERLDANKDGKVTKEEHLKSSESSFMEVDTDKDGGVNFKEMLAKAQSSSNVPAEMKPKMESIIKGAFEKMDKDKSGKISKDEMMGVNASNGFAQMDMDKDGVITEKDFVARGMAMKEEAKKAQEAAAAAGTPVTAPAAATKKAK